MASICNDERGHFGVVSGHGRKTLRLSGNATGQRGVSDARRAMLSTARKAGTHAVPALRAVDAVD